jgi:hypothetical protein
MVVMNDVEETELTIGQITELDALAKGKRRRGKAEGDGGLLGCCRDCNFFSATVSVASLKRRQSASETIAPTQNDRHILVATDRLVLTHRATAINIIDRTDFDCAQPRFDWGWDIKHSRNPKLTGLTHLRPKSPSNLGGLESSSPQVWGARGAKKAELRKSWIFYFGSQNSSDLGVASYCWIARFTSGMCR